VLRQVMGVVDVKQTGEHELTLEWESSASNDMVADSALALITGIDRSPASVKREYILSYPFHSSFSSQRSSPSEFIPT
jgi:cleavage and polyadenylation specificity factor subunit 3